MSSLEESYRYCRDVARSRARNFYYSFLLLERAQRDAMCAVYAFMRYCDDLSDEPGASREAIERWRGALGEALGGRFDGHPCWPAFHDTVVRYGIPECYFYQMIEGVASDLEPRRFATFEELYRYCYQVASVVGLTTIHIFGFHSREAMPLAEKCGVAFQLTNILRDIREDAAAGRLYLPEEDLRHFGVAGPLQYTPEVVELLRFEAARAHAYYDQAAPLVGMVEPRSRASLAALIGIYSRLLERIEADRFDVFSRRISLPAWEKTWIVLRSMARD